MRPVICIILTPWEAAFCKENYRPCLMSSSTYLGYQYYVDSISFWLRNLVTSRANASLTPIFDTTIPIKYSRLFLEWYNLNFKRL